MSKTRSEKNMYCREWRKNCYKEKRFNKPMHEFIQLKYRDIYNEYCWFYKSLDEQHPSSKDLTKTTTFRNWKTRQLNCEFTDDETEAEQIETQQTEAEQIETGQTEAEQIETEQTVAEQIETEQTVAEQIETEQTEAEQIETGQTEAEQIETEQTVAESDHPDILSIALEETVPIDNNIDIDHIDNVIQQVVYELEQDEAIRELMNNEGLVNPHYQDEDEGIDLDIETELEAIIEPFDYSEVEGFDF